MKPKRRTTIYNWLTNHYRLVLRNEENLSEKTTLRLNYAKVIVFAVVGLIFLFILSFMMSSWWLNRYNNSGRAQAAERKKMVRLASTLDSIQAELENRDAVIKNFRSIVSGEADLAKKTDKEEATDIPVKIASNALDSMDMAEEMMRLELEQSMNAEVGTSAETDLLGQIFFFKPVEGIVNEELDIKNGFHGIGILAKANEPVKAIADGTVIFSTWNVTEGYVIGIQHRSNLISVYKYNGSLSRKAGDAVRAGETIAFVGTKTTALHSESMLQLEIWYNGNPINPKNLINF